MSDEKLERWVAAHDGEKISLMRRADGYWTPWGAANAEITRLRAENAELRNRLVNLEDEKNDYINCVGDALGQAPDGESLWDAAQRVLSDRDRVRQERDELRAQIAAHERECAGKWVKVTERLSGCGVLLGLSKLLRRKHDKR